MTLGERVNKIRKAQGMGLDELSARSGVPKGTLAKVTSGITSNPSLDTVRAIASALNCSLDDLDDFVPFPNTKNTPTSSGGKAVIPVLGDIPAGIPVEAIEDIVDYEEISGHLLQGGHEYFGLKVKGDSMYPKYLEGDTIIVRKQPTCENGQDCVVYVNGFNATLKTVKRHPDGSLTLQPLNPEYPPHTYSPQDVESLPVSICGVVAELRRTIL